jgi:hypothetical protein
VADDNMENAVRLRVVKRAIIVRRQAYGPRAST